MRRGLSKMVILMREREREREKEEERRRFGSIV